MILDYLFFRAYVAYEKKKEPGLFAASAYISVCCIFLFIPVIGLFIEYLNNSKLKIIAFVFYCVLILFSIFYNYHKKSKIEKIIKRYKGSVYNNRIPIWMIFLILPISMFVGVGLYIIL